MENKKLNILIIDDIQDNIIALNALLKEAFQEAVILSALNGFEGLRIAADEKPDVILLDIIMPGMDGYEVCQKLKKDPKLQIIPVIFVTALKDDKESKIKALESGADAFLTKPVDETELTAQIRAMIRIKEAEERKLDENVRLRQMVTERTNELQNELWERERTEEALKESEERFQLLFNKAPLGYQSLDSDGCFIEVNQQWLETLGYEYHEVIGKWFGDFLAPDYRNAFRERFPLFKAQGQIHSEFEMLHKNGSILFIAFEGRIGNDILGNFKQTHCILQNITEQKKAQNALVESENKYSVLFNDSPDAYLIISDGVFSDCNRATEILLGGIREQIVGKTPDELSPEYQPDGKKSVDAAKERIEEVLQNGKNTFEWIHRKFDGSDLYVEVSLAPISLNGSIVLFTSWRDISKRKLAENSLIQINATHADMIANIGDVIGIIGADGIMKYKSPNIENYFGWKPEELVGKNTWTMVHPEDLDRIQTVFFELLDNDQSSSQMEFRYKCKDGTYKWVELKATNRINSIHINGILINYHDITSRIFAEETLRESEERFRHISSSISDISYSCVLDPDGNSKINWLYGATETITGYTSEEIIEMQCWGKLVIQKDFPVFAEKIIGSKPGQSEICDLRIQKKDGKIIWIQASSECVKGESGTNIIYGGLLDINERMLANETLRKSEEKYHSMVDLLPDAIIIHAEGKIVFANAATYKITGATSTDQLIGRSVIDFVHPDDISNAANRIKTILESGEPSAFAEERFIGVNNEIKDAEVIGIPVSYMGKPAVQTILRDISERKKAEFDLKERNTFIQTVLDNLPIGLALNSIYEGTALYMNKKFEEIYGWPSEEIKDISDFFQKVYPDENYRNELIKRIMTDVQSGDASRMHWENCFITHKDGSRHCVNAVNIPLQEQNTMVSTVTDITERKKAEEDLKQALIRAEESDRLKSAFLANMSHEVRTPLNSIIGFSELLLDNDFSVDQHHDFARSINISGNSLLTIISDIMDISKIEAGQLKLNWNQVSVRKFITHLKNEFLYPAKEKGIELRLDPENPKIEIIVTSDENRLRQILINFISNALKFTQTGFVEIGFRVLPDSVQFHVKDSGIGIPVEFHQQIFERFRQVESAETRKFGGNGLGLAISKHLAELLGGKIGMESEPGKGSTFYVEIPYTLI